MFAGFQRESRNIRYSLDIRACCGQQARLGAAPTIMAGV
jgi:hypothetical protein